MTLQQHFGDHSVSGVQAVSIPVSSERFHKLKTTQSRKSLVESEQTNGRESNWSLFQRIIKKWVWSQCLSKNGVTRAAHMNSHQTTAGLCGDSSSTSSQPWESRLATNGSTTREQICKIAGDCPTIWTTELLCIFWNTGTKEREPTALECIHFSVHSLLL